MVELVDDHVVEARQIVLSEERGARQRLHRGEHGVAVELGAPVDDVADAARRVHRRECGGRLAQQLLAMGDEQHSRGVARIEGGEEGLAQTRRRDDERPAMPVGSESLQFAQRQHLGGSGLDAWLWLGRCVDERTHPPSRTVGLDPRRGQRVHVRTVPELVESRPKLVERLAGIEVQHGPGPLDAVSQAAAREVRRADERTTRAVRALEQIRLGMEAAPRMAVDARLEAAVQSEQRIERVGLGHVEVVGGEQANVGTAQQGGAQSAVEQLGAAAHHEGDREARMGAALELGADRVQ